MVAARSLLHLCSSDRPALETTTPWNSAYAGIGMHRILPTKSGTGLFPL